LCAQSQREPRLEERDQSYQEQSRSVGRSQHEQLRYRLYGVIGIDVAVGQMGHQMLGRVLVGHHDNMMSGGSRAAVMRMDQMGMCSGNTNGCQNQAKYEDHEGAGTHMEDARILGGSLSFPTGPLPSLAAPWLGWEACRRV
jgi:hypothetical protein